MKNTISSFSLQTRNLEEDNHLEFVVEKEWLMDNLENEEVIIIDCRFDLNQPELGREQYKNSHIPSAFYFDLKHQLSGPITKHGGRHPLPDIDTFRIEIEKVGIDHSKTVIAYDEGGGQYASRLWWLMKYIGHEKIYILNEGFSGWKAANFPVTTEIPEAKPTNYKVNIQKEMLASFEEVKEIVENTTDESVLIDSRASERYLGKVEPMDKIPGHIPGALNKVWDESLHEGSFKNEEEQRERFSEIDKDEPVVVYCGSGVTATPNYIALKMAGFTDVKLYAGGYSDWVSYEDNEIEKGKVSREN